MDIYNLVRKQHQHFGLSYAGKPRHLDNKEKNFYIEALHEEIEEYNSAIDLEEEYDSLLDMLVFTLGAMQRHGFHIEGLEKVIEANMKKELGPIENKRNDFELDLRKPEGWEHPDLKEFLI